jgi:hypothetical protein
LRPRAHFKARSETLAAIYRRTYPAVYAGREAGTHTFVRALQIALCTIGLTAADARAAPVWFDPGGYFFSLVGWGREISTGVTPSAHNILGGHEPGREWYSWATVNNPEGFSRPGKGMTPSRISISRLSRLRSQLFAGSDWAGYRWRRPTGRRNLRLHQLPRKRQLRPRKRKRWTQRIHLLSRARSYRSG